MGERIYNLRECLKDLYMSVDGIAEKTFLSERPRHVDDAMNDFIVVTMPYKIDNKMFTPNAYWNTTIFEFLVFVRDVDCVYDINRMDDILAQVEDVFPISTSNIKSGRYTITDNGSDGYGFHYCTIQCTANLYDI